MSYAIRKAIKNAILENRMRGREGTYWRAGLQQALAIIDEEVDKQATYTTRKPDDRMDEEAAWEGAWAA